MSESGGAPAAQTIRVAAVHLGGVRDLAAGQGELELRFSDAGLHIFDIRHRAVVGQLSWSEIRSLQLPPRRRGLRRAPRHLELTTDGGRARFELPGITDGQVREHLSPLLDRLR